MARVQKQGYWYSENGWPMVDQGSCIWITVPGTDVSIQVAQGVPQACIAAFLADVHAFVEKLRDEDTACYTESNKVASSNHNSATAADANWNEHPMGEAYTGWSPEEINQMRQLLAFWDGIMFWAEDWDTPKDSMHFQMDYGTWDDGRGAPAQYVVDWIAKNIRPDGFSTYRRGSTVVLSKKDEYALATIKEGQRLEITPLGIKIALSVELVETNLTIYANSNVPASLNLPHDAVGSDHDSTGLFQQRQAWGPLSSTMDPTLSARLFFLGGQGGQRGLTDFDYNSNSRTPGGWAQAVQVSAFPDRYDQRFSDAEAIYNRLVGLSEEDDMFTDADRELLRQVSGIRRPSLSPLRHVGEGDVNTCAGFAWSADALTHAQFVAMAARHGHKNSIQLLGEVAACTDPARAEDAKLAKAILTDIATNNPEALQGFQPKDAA